MTRRPMCSWLWLPTLWSLSLSPAVAQSGAADEPVPRRVQVLFFGAPTANGPHHDPITRYRVLKQALGTDGIDFTYCEDPAKALDGGFLAAFDVVLMYGNWAQQAPMPRPQLQALDAFVRGGRGFVPVHCASACFGGSPEFVRLVGARFRSHGGDEFEVANLDPDHPILRGVPGYRAWDETYVHDSHADDRQLLQTRDGEPWSWTRQHGQGRVFYTASGHDHRVWDRAEFQALLRNAILWAAGPTPSRALELLQLPRLETEPVSLPGYRERREITVAQKPLAPAASMKLAQVPVGMRLVLFACEPEIVNPIHIAWDPRGRAFVTETVDYPNNLQPGTGHDRITICEDTDGDERADRFTRFAEQLSIPTSMAFANGGVICTNGPEVLFLADTDGDDRADVRKTLFRGIQTGDTHAGLSNLRYGIDGWLYATIGYAGFDGEVGGVRHEFAQGLLRFRTDGRALEFLQHTTNNTWGLGFTEEFDIVGSTANANPSWFFTFPDALRAAAGMPTDPVPRADDNPLFFPMSTDIRQVDSFDRYTSAAGHAVYTARRFPQAWWNRIAFVCEPTGKLVGQFELVADGAGFRAVQSPNNLYASADAWSSPVCAEVGPDGAVWICDWYHLVVQHNPTPSRGSAGVDARTGRGNAYETPLRETRHGRIYRVVPGGTVPPTAPTLDPEDVDSLCRGLGSDNLAVRLHAQRLLVERGGTTAAPALRELVRAGGVAAAHALEALLQLGALDAELLEAALAADRPALRRRALAHADPAQLRRAYLRDGSLAAGGRELALLLVGLSRAAQDPELGSALFALAAAPATPVFGDRTLREAWQLAARSQAAAVLLAAAAAGAPTVERREPVNLLPNPGFLTTADESVQDWTDLRVYSGGGRAAVKFGADERGHRDASSLRVSTDRAVDCGVAVTVPVARSTRYRLSGWIRTEDLRPVRGSPGALLNVHGGQRTAGVRGTADWTEVAVEFDSGDRQQIVVHCLFGGYGGATGSAWFDDIALVALGSGATLAGALEELAAFRKAPTAPAAAAVRTFAPDAEVHRRGAEVYARTCIACHGVDGRGVPQAFPPLDGSDWLTGDPELPVRIVLHGLFGPIVVGEEQFTNMMAPLGPLLTDREVADVLTYVRQRWRNDAAPVDTATVRRIRAANKNRTMWTAAELGR